MNIIDYFVNTYEEVIPKKSRSRQSNNPQNTSTGSLPEDDNNSDEHRKPGCKPNPRVLYHSEHPMHTSKQRVLRSSGHNVLPNFIGRFFPRRDDPEIYSFYCASMLMLLKPWRDPRTDLKAPSQSWAQAFESFVETAPKKIQNILSGIQYFHDCTQAAKRSRQQSHDETPQNPPTSSEPEGPAEF